MKSHSRIGRRYGWIPSLPDRRVLKYAYHAQMIEILPESVDLRPYCPKIYDQARIGSCTANASAGMAEFLMIKSGKVAFTPSRLFIYYNERVIEGTIGEDSGASLSDAIKVLTLDGAPRESLWWYNTEKFTVKPNRGIYADGAKHRVTGSMSLNNRNISELKSCLASGYPFMFGVTVYQSFEDNVVERTGMVPLPGLLEKQLGGHALMCVGYDDARGLFIVRNSWGSDWGMGGYCLVPYAYLTDPDMAQDFWTFRAID